MRQRMLLVVLVSSLAAWQVACGGGGGGKISQPPSEQLGITVSASSPNATTGGTVNLSSAVTGGDGNAAVKWSTSPANVGSFSTAMGTSTIWTAPATLTTSPETVTITATATDGAGSTAQTATADVKVTVARVITLGIDLPNDELYSDFDWLLTVTMTCSGCEVGDTLNSQSPYLQGAVVQSDPMQNANYLASWPALFNFSGYFYVQGPIKVWVTGTDGITSNTLWLMFDGSQNETVQDPSTGEVYYCNSGDGTDGSGGIMKFKPDGTADGSYQHACSGDSVIAFDNNTIYRTQAVQLSSGVNGIGTVDFTSGIGGLIPLTNGEPLAIGAKDGLVCVTIPTGGTSPNSTDAVDCHNSGGTFTLPGIPADSEPTAVKVIDSSHAEVYGRGDQMLRWYTISGAAGVAAGTLQLSEFTKTDSSYWNTYPATGGWEIAQVGSTIGVMGQVVNGDGTVSQKLALVNNTNQALIQYADLPAGTVHITGDAANNAIVAEYPDSTGTTPITRFERIYVDTGNSTTLGSTSNLVPGAGFLVTQDGSAIATCADGKCDFEPNE